MAALGTACAASARQVRAAEAAHVEFRGAITELVPHYSPFLDPVNYPPLQLDPAFVARFAPGQSVIVQTAYLLDAEDDIAASYWGRYGVEAIGSLSVDGLEFPLGHSVVNLTDDQPETSHPTDQWSIYALITQSSAAPVASPIMTFRAALQGEEIVHSDALVPPPLQWDGTVGYVGFETGIIWQSLRFSIDSVVTSVVNHRAGDFNLDGFVDVEDLLHWQATVGPVNGDRRTADADADDDVDGDDFLAWQRELGGSATGAASAPVPEPGTLLPLGAALAVVIRTRQNGARTARRQTDARTR